MIQEFAQNDICYYSGDVFVLLVNYYFHRFTLKIKQPELLIQAANMNNMHRLT